MYLPLSNVLPELSTWLRTTVNGACVLEKKHIAIGPNNGKIDNVEPPIDGGDGPNRKFVKGDVMAVIGEIRYVTVSKTGYFEFHFTLFANIVKISSKIEFYSYVKQNYT